MLQHLKYYGANPIPAGGLDFQGIQNRGELPFLKPDIHHGTYYLGNNPAIIRH
jgi:hypothetical protein